VQSERKPDFLVGKSTKPAPFLHIANNIRLVFYISAFVLLLFHLLPTAFAQASAKSGEKYFARWWTARFGSTQ